MSRGLFICLSQFHIQSARSNHFPVPRSQQVNPCTNPGWRILLKNVEAPELRNHGIGCTDQIPPSSIRPGRPHSPCSRTLGRISYALTPNLDFEQPQKALGPLLGVLGWINPVGRVPYIVRFTAASFARDL